MDTLLVSKVREEYPGHVRDDRDEPERRGGGASAVVGHTHGRRVGAPVSHDIAAMAVSRILSGRFMWEARRHITCDEWIDEGFSHGIVATLTAHLLQMCFRLDIMSRAASELGGNAL